MKTYNIQNARYSVNGYPDFSLTDALKLWKAKFETIKHFIRDVINHPALSELGEFVQEVWDSIEPITVTEALNEQNLERRRIMFDCIGVSRLFKEMNPVLLDKQTISKKRIRWNEANEPYQYNYEDTYELYELDSHRLFPLGGPYPNRQQNIYAVRCWCTTTAREYWIYVPKEIALNQLFWQTNNFEPDAIRAIAWTIKIDISNPERIYRQGDIIIVKESEQSTVVTPYHLTKDQYLKLMYSET